MTHRVSDEELSKIITHNEWTSLYSRQEILLNKLALDLRDAREKLKAITKRLENLTPLGSEFADNPARCLDWIEEQYQARLRIAVEESAAANIAQAEMTRLTRERRELAEAVAATGRSYDPWIGEQCAACDAKWGPDAHQSHCIVGRALAILNEGTNGSDAEPGSTSTAQTGGKEEPPARS